MPTPLYHVLETVTLTSSASSVTFSSIDQSYADLVLQMEAVATSSNTPKVRFNSDSGSNYYSVSMQGLANGNTGSYSSTSNFLTVQVANVKTKPSLFTVQVFDYSATDKHKSALSRCVAVEDDGSLDRVGAVAARWANTSAITSITLDGSTGSWDTGSTFTLYATTKAV